MIVNGDLAARVVVATAAMPWRTAGEGVEEKLLENTHDATRRTALVRLAANASVPAHTAGCLDLFVLAGELRDDHVVHGPGAYLHTPVGRALSTRAGCTLFVKQRPAKRLARHALDTRMVVFETSHPGGLRSAPLHEDLDGKVVLLRFDPGAEIGHHHHDDGEEFFVLSGEVRDELGAYATHDWVRQPPGSSHRITSRSGCLFLTFAHHLRTG